MYVWRCAECGEDVDEICTDCLSQGLRYPGCPTCGSTLPVMTEITVRPAFAQVPDELYVDWEYGPTATIEPEGPK